MFFVCVYNWVGPCACDIPYASDLLVRQLAVPQHRMTDVDAVRSLLAAVSYKLGYVQSGLRA